MMTKNNRGKFFALKLCCLLPAMALPVALFGLSTAETKPPVNKETAVATTIANDTLRVTVTDDDAQAGVIVIAMKSGDTLVFNGYDKQALNALNPDDIQSMSILKGKITARTVPSAGTSKITVEMKSGDTLVFNGYDKQALDALNPDDIQSITVQKEKMAAQSVPSAVTGTITVVKKSGETIIFDPDDINSITVQKDTAKSMVKYTRVEDSTKTYYYFKKDTAKTKKEKVYLVGKVDVNPEFPGGMSALSKFIKDNLKYPKEAADKKIEGRVTVEFIVKADGSIDDIKVLKGVDALLDAEALHIIKILPNWTPGKLKGKAVAVKFILPISFQIPKDKAPETK